MNEQALEAFGRAVAELVRGAVADAIAAHRAADEPAPRADRLVDMAELIDALGISESTARRMVRDGCPVEHFGAALRFDVAAVRAWARERGKRAMSTSARRAARATLPEGVTRKTPRSRRL